MYVKCNYGARPSRSFPYAAGAIILPFLLVNISKWFVEESFYGVGVVDRLLAALGLRVMFIATWLHAVAKMF